MKKKYINTTIRVKTNTLFDITHGAISRSLTLVSFGYTGPQIYKKLIKKNLANNDLYEKDFDAISIGDGIFYFHEKFTMVAFPRYEPENPEHLGAIVHELCHLTQYMFYARGIHNEYDKYGIQETFAYQTEYYLRQILRHLGWKDTKKK